MANLLQYNLALEERLDKHRSWLYKLENLNIPHHVRKAVNEIVTDAVDWAMQAPLQARFSDLPTTNSYQIWKKLARRKKRRDLPRTPFGSPPPHPLPPSPAGASGAPSTSGASGYSQLPPPPPPLSTGTSGSAQQKEERPATPEPAWTIPSSNVSDVEKNWATALVLAYETPTENSLLAKTRDMMNFLNWYCRQVNKTALTLTDLEGQAYEVVKAFYPDVIHLQFQMEECHKMLTDQVDWTNPEGDQVRVDVSQQLPLACEGSSPALSISKMKATIYPDFHLKLLMPEQIHASPSRKKEVRSNMRILSVVKIKAYSRYGYDYLSEIVLRRADLQEHTIAEKDFKNLYPSDVEDLNLLILQGHLDHLLESDKWMLSTDVKLWTRNLVIRQRHDYTIIESPRSVVISVNNNKQKIMRFNKIYKFSDGTLTQILEALAYRVKKFKLKRLNLGKNTRFWTQKDVTKSKEFIAAIERRLKTRRIYQKLEYFVGGRVRDIDYRLLQKME
nr:hypothetical protein [Tanacetum cinerariifolium]